jgi:hypothetical protein
VTSSPRRPLPLDRRFVASSLLVAGLPAAALAALGAVALTLTLEDAERLRRQDEIMQWGQRAEHAEVDIERDLSFFVFRARRYEVRFEDAAGATHAGREREHDMSIAPLVVEGPPVVHYDPQDPSRFAVGFASQNLGAQHAAIALLGGVGALLLVLAAACFTFLTRGLRRALAAAAGGRAGVAEVVSLERSFDSRGEPTGELHLVIAPTQADQEAGDTYRDRADRDAHASEQRLPAGLRESVVTPADDGPVFLDEAGTRVLVVTTPHGEPVLVRRSGRPFRLAPHEQAALRRGVLARAPRSEALAGRVHRA